MVFSTVPVDGEVSKSFNVVSNGGGVEVVNNMTASSIQLRESGSTTSDVVSSTGSVVSVEVDSMDVVFTGVRTVVVSFSRDTFVVEMVDTTSTTGRESSDSPTLSTCFLAKAFSMSMEALSSCRILSMMAR